MDWFRRLFGFPDSRSLDANPFQNPTWEEIMEHRDFSSRPRTPGGDFFSGSSDQNGPYYWSGSHEDLFSSMFGQMDDMMRQFDHMMQGFHYHQQYPGQLIITEGPDFEDPVSSDSPRNSLLKKPDSDPSADDGSIHHNMPPGHHRSPYGSNPNHPGSIFQGPFFPHDQPPDSDSPGSDFHGGFQNFGNFGGAGALHPFHMMEDILRGFGGMFEDGPFRDFPGAPMLPGPDMESGEDPRSSGIKKEDSDLDDRPKGDLSQLLKEGAPNYSKGGTSRFDKPFHTQPESSDLHPRVHQSYRSTSIIRIRKPDGSTEETRKYTDSSGREEVVVTHTEPEHSPMNPPLGPGEYGGQDAHSGRSSNLPSIFSWIFTR